MSLKFLNVKLGILASGLGVIIMLMAVFSAGEQARAATPTTDCVGPLSTQEKAGCAEAEHTPVPGLGTMVAWFFPGSENPLTRTDAILTKSPETGIGKATKEEASSGLPRDALLMFGAAILGIIYLGRRRRKLPVDEK